MFDNLLYQNTGNLLTSDISRSSVPGSILLSGPAFSGKLTCALELARVLSCTEKIKGAWSCNCTSCLRNKALVSPDVLLCGPRDCSLEIAAARKTFLEAVKTNKPYKSAAQYLFIRSIRKLTLRFSQILWEDDDKVSKIASLTSIIDELLEELDPNRNIPEINELEKITDELYDKCCKLESGFMYDSLPVSQIRHISSWARLTAVDGKKVVIIENADQMQETSRNALLKILEEPPSDVIFILLTTRRGAVMPTILSRVRTYAFVERTLLQQEEVISRVFHDQITTNSNASEISNTSDNGVSVALYLQKFLPVKPELLDTLATNFLNQVYSGGPVLCEEIVKKASGFEPRLLLKLFLNNILIKWRSSLLNANNASVSERQYKGLSAVRACLLNVSTFNQSPSAALEQLVEELRSI